MTWATLAILAAVVFVVTPMKIAGNRAAVTPLLVVQCVIVVAAILGIVAITIAKASA